MAPSLVGPRLLSLFRGTACVRDHPLPRVSGVEPHTVMVTYAS